MLESFSISPFFLGNLDLEPERSRSVEVGVDQRLAGDRAKVEVTWFDNRFSDIISLRTDPATFEAQYFNVGVTRARGLEFGVQVAPIPAIRARARLHAARFGDRRDDLAGQRALRTRPMGCSGGRGIRVRSASTFDWQRADRRHQRRRSSAGSSTATSACSIRR